MDANAYAQQITPASKSLGVAIRSAAWLGSGKAPAVVSVATALSKAESAAPVPTAPTKLEPSQTGNEAAAQADPPTPLAAKQEASESNEAPSSARRPEVPRASPLPPAPRAEVDAEVKEQEVVLRFGDRRWRVRGLAKNMSYDQLRVNLLASVGERFHVDSFDLYSARHRASFLKQAATELRVEEDVLKKDLGKVLLKLEDLQDQQIQSALNPKDDVPEITEAQREAALKLLKAPDLLDQILGDFDRCGRAARRYIKADLLMIDDFAVLEMDPAQAKLAFQIISERYDYRRSTMITTNRPFKDWTKVFPDALNAQVIAERLTERSEHFVLNGKGYGTRGGHNGMA